MCSATRRLASKPGQFFNLDTTPPTDYTVRWAVCFFRVQVNRSTCRRTMFLFGLSDGLVFFTLMAVQFYRLSSSGVPPHRLSLFVWTGLPYNLRFCCQFLVDRVRVPVLSKWYSSRKAWGVVAHVGSLVGFLLLSFLDGATQWESYLLVAFVTSFFSAIQSVVSSAYQFMFEPVLPLEETVPTKTLGFRSGQFGATALLPLMSSVVGWPWAHALLVSFKVAALVQLLLLLDPAVELKKTSNAATHEPPPSFRTVVRQSLRKPFTGQFLVMLFLFKGVETVLGPIQTEFLGTLGISSRQYGFGKNTLGFGAMLLGILTAQRLAKTMNAYKALMLAALGQGVSALLSPSFLHVDPSQWNHLLVGVSCAQEFAQGMATTLLILTISLFSDRSMSVYHFTLLSTIGSLARSVWTSTYNALLVVIPWQAVFFVPLGLWALLGLFILTWGRCPHFWQVFEKKIIKRINKLHDDLLFVSNDSRKT